MSGDGELPDPRERQKRVADDDNQSQNATIRRIQSFRDDIAEYQLAFAQAEVSGDLSERQLHRSYHQLARGFLQLLKPYLTDDDIPKSRYYWEGVADTDEEGDEDPLHLGDIVVEPPKILERPNRDEVAASLKAGATRADTSAGVATGVRSMAQNNLGARRYSVQGLQDFAALDPEWRESWTVAAGPTTDVADLRRYIQDDAVEVHDRQGRASPLRVSKLVRVDRDIIDGAVTSIEQFIRDVGMDVELESDGLPSDEI